IHFTRARGRRTGSEGPTCESLGLPRGFRHGLGSERRTFSIKIHPTCRLNPSLLLIASIEALPASFHVFMVRYPFFFPKSMTLSFGEVAMPLPLYSRMSLVSSAFWTAGFAS